MMNKQQTGFTLVEIAIVLVIFGLVMTALLMPLQAQRTRAAQLQTEATLESAKRSLLGFAQAQGRLPCPATAVSNGAEAPLGGGACTVQTGFLPASTLGVQPTDAQGFALDAWNNRIRYAVTQSSTALIVNPATPDFTSNIEDNIATPLVNEADGLNTIGIANLTPNIRVCGTSTAANCSAAINLINNAVAVIYSLGTTGLQAAGGVDETENLNAVAGLDNVFVHHDLAAAGAPNGEYDHLMVWISPFVLYNSMIEAGQLH